MVAKHVSLETRKKISETFKGRYIGIEINSNDEEDGLE